MSSSVTVEVDLATLSIRVRSGSASTALSNGARRLPVSFEDPRDEGSTRLRDIRHAGAASITCEVCTWMFTRDGRGLGVLPGPPGAVRAGLWRLGGNARKSLKAVLEAVPAGCLGHAIQYVALVDELDRRPSSTLQGDGAAVDGDHPGVIASASAYITPSVAHRSKLVGRVILDDEGHLALDVAITAGLHERAMPVASELARRVGSRIGRDAGDGAGPLRLGAAHDESGEGGK